MLYNIYLIGDPTQTPLAPPICADDSFDAYAQLLVDQPDLAPQAELLIAFPIEGV